MVLEKEEDNLEKVAMGNHEREKEQTDKTTPKLPTVCLLA